MGGFRSIIGAVAVLVAGSAVAQVQSQDQAGCVLRLTKAGARVATAVGRELVSCVARASKGRLAAGETAQECLLADAKGRIADALSDTVDGQGKSCGALPDFGADTAATVNVTYGNLRAPARVFGPRFGGVIAGGANGKCQRAVAKSVALLLDMHHTLFRRCVRSGFKDGRITSADWLATCIGADPKGRVVRLTGRLTRKVTRKCGAATISDALPGDCSAATAATLMACVAPRVACDACRSSRFGNRLGGDCDPEVEGDLTPRCSPRLSAAREWNEALLGAIRVDLPRPTVHARNLFHTSVAIYDAWAAYDSSAPAYLVEETASAPGMVEDARAEAVSYAAYRLLVHRFMGSVGAATSLPAFDARMARLGYDPLVTTTEGAAPAAVGNRIGAAVIAFGATDGANEANDYADPDYAPVNEPLIVKLPGTTLVDPNRWQALALDFFVSQNGIPLPISVQTFVGSHWDAVTPFALVPGDPSADPGPPPQLGGVDDAAFKDANVEVVRFSSVLDPDDGVSIDISPGALHNNTLGTQDGTGYPVNPHTGRPYAPNVVKRADYGRVLAEFWADGPDSETPPGHWNVVANDVSDGPLLVKRIGGAGPVVSDLEWDVKMYLGLNGAVHDAAIAAWDSKEHYDYVRPISSIRHMAGLGQSSDAGGPSYHPDGIPLEPGLVEVITAATSAPGARHAHLADSVGEIALFAWPGEPADPENQYSGAEWVRALEWVPYQRKTFVTPPFAGYVSGHSTFSRAAAEFLTRFTGSDYFPGGLGELVVPADESLEFEIGPTETVTLQWARYYDAADEAGISRLYGGIHVRADDFAGRIMGAQVGVDAWVRALEFHGIP